VNDTFGHQEGDRAIHEVAKAIMTSLSISVDDAGTYCEHLVESEDNFAGRLGGDEFVFVVRHCMADTELRYVMERLRITVANIDIKGDKPLTVSGGIVEFEHDRSTADRLYHQADEMLYRAKEGGKDRYCIRSLDGTVTQSPAR
jgi:diguanylate cyclase (GGDEF)-like protein